MTLISTTSSLSGQDDSLRSHSADLAGEKKCQRRIVRVRGSVDLAAQSIFLQKPKCCEIAVSGPGY